MIAETLVTTAGAAVSQALADLAERVRAGVVQVSDGRGGGAGTIWSNDGLVITNHHVVPGERARVTLADGSTHAGRVIANLPERDLSVLKVEAEGLTPLPAGDVNRLRPGELVMAVGHPLGVPGSVSLGVFSGIGPIEGGRGRHLREAILANVELRPGNSGGPLVNVRGEVIGINAMVIGHGTALAVPSSTVARLLGARQRRTLGVQVGVVQAPASLVRQLGLSHAELVMVLEVVPDSPAATAGLLPGDLLLEIGPQPIEEPGDIPWALAGASPGQALNLMIVRGGERRTVEFVTRDAE